MKRKRFTEEQIITILKEHEAGMRVQDRVRKHNVSEQSIYRWKSKYGGMAVSDARKLRDLEDENRRLKSWLPISVWTSRCWKMFYQKSGEACGT